MNQDDYIKQLEKQIDDLQQQYGKDSIRVENYEQLIETILSRSKLRRVKINGTLTVETSLTLDAVGIIERNSPLAEFVTKALIEAKRQEEAELAVTLFLESGAEGIELPDNG